MKLEEWVDFLEKQTLPEKLADRVVEIIRLGDLLEIDPYTVLISVEWEAAKEAGR